MIRIDSNKLRSFCLGESFTADSSRIQKVMPIRPEKKGRRRKYYIDIYTGVISLEHLKKGESELWIEAYLDDGQEAFKIASGDTANMSVLDDSKSSSSGFSLLQSLRERSVEVEAEESMSVDITFEAGLSERDWGELGEFRGAITESLTKYRKEVPTVTLTKPTNCIIVSSEETRAMLELYEDEVILIWMRSKLRGFPVCLVGDEGSELEDDSICFSSITGRRSDSFPLSRLVSKEIGNIKEAKRAIWSSARSGDIGRLVQTSQVELEMRGAVWRIGALESTPREIIAGHLTGEILKHRNEISSEFYLILSMLDSRKAILMLEGQVQDIKTLDGDLMFGLMDEIEKALVRFSENITRDKLDRETGTRDQRAERIRNWIRSERTLLHQIPENRKEPPKRPVSIQTLMDFCCDMEEELVDSGARFLKRAMAEIISKDLPRCAEEVIKQFGAVPSADVARNLDYCKFILREEGNPERLAKLEFVIRMISDFNVSCGEMLSRVVMSSADKLASPDLRRLGARLRESKTFSLIKPLVQRCRGKLFEIYLSEKLDLMNLEESFKPSLIDILLKNGLDPSKVSHEVITNLNVKPDFTFRTSRADGVRIARTLLSVSSILPYLYREDERSVSGMAAEDFIAAEPDVVREGLGKEAMTIEDLGSEVRSHRAVQLSNATGINLLYKALESEPMVEKNFLGKEQGVMFIIEAGIAAGSGIEKQSRDIQKYHSLPLIDGLGDKVVVITLTADDSDLSRVNQRDSSNVKNVLTALNIITSLSRSLLGRGGKMESLLQMSNNFSNMSTPLGDATMLSNIERLGEITFDSRPLGGALSKISGPLIPLIIEKLTIRNDLPKVIMNLDQASFTTMMVRVLERVRLRSGLGDKNLTNLEELGGSRTAGDHFKFLEALSHPIQNEGDVFLQSLMGEMKDHDSVSATKDLLGEQRLSKSKISRICCAADGVVDKTPYWRQVVGLHREQSYISTNTSNEKQGVIRKRLKSDENNGRGFLIRGVQDMILSILNDAMIRKTGMVSSETAVIQQESKLMRSAKRYGPQDGKRKTTVRMLVGELCDVDRKIIFLGESVPGIKTRSGRPSVLKEIFNRAGPNRRGIDVSARALAVSTDPLNIGRLVSVGAEKFKNFQYTTLLTSALTVQEVLYSREGARPKMKAFDIMMCIHSDEVEFDGKRQMLRKDLETLMSAISECQTCYKITDSVSICAVEGLERFGIDCSCKLGVPRDMMSKLNYSLTTVKESLNNVQGINTEWKLACMIAYTISLVTGEKIGNESNGCYSERIDKEIIEELNFDITRRGVVERNLKSLGAANLRAENVRREFVFVRGISKHTRLQESQLLLSSELEPLRHRIQSDVMSCAMAYFPTAGKEHTLNVMEIALKVIFDTGAASKFIVPMICAREALKCPTKGRREIIKTKLHRNLDLVICGAKTEGEAYDFLFVMRNGSVSRFRMDMDSLIPMLNAIPFFVFMLASLLIEQTSILEKFWDSTESKMHRVKQSDEFVLTVMEAYEDQTQMLRRRIDALNVAILNKDSAEASKIIWSCRCDISDLNPHQIAKTVAFISMVSLPAILENDLNHNGILQSYRFPACQSMSDIHSRSEFPTKMAKKQRSYATLTHSLFIWGISARCMTLKATILKYKDNREKIFNSGIHLDPMTMTQVLSEQGFMKSIYGVHYYVRGLMKIVPSKVAVFDAYMKIPDMHCLQISNQLEKLAGCGCWGKVQRRVLRVHDTLDDLLPREADICFTCLPGIKRLSRLIQVPLIRLEDLDQLENHIFETLLEQSQDKISYTHGDPYYMIAMGKVVINSLAEDETKSFEDFVPQSVSITDFVNSRSAIDRHKEDLDPAAASMMARHALLQGMNEGKRMTFTTSEIPDKIIQSDVEGMRNCLNDIDDENASLVSAILEEEVSCENISTGESPSLILSPSFTKLLGGSMEGGIMLGSYIKKLMTGVYEIDKDKMSQAIESAKGLGWKGGMINFHPNAVLSLKQTFAVPEIEIAEGVQLKGLPKSAGVKTHRQLHQLVEGMRNSLHLDSDKRSKFHVDGERQRLKRSCLREIKAYCYNRIEKDSMTTNVGEERELLKAFLRVLDDKLDEGLTREEIIREIGESAVAIMIDDSHLDLVMVPVEGDDGEITIHPIKEGFNNDFEELEEDSKAVLKAIVNLALACEANFKSESTEKAGLISASRSAAQNLQRSLIRKYDKCLVTVLQKAMCKLTQFPITELFPQSFNHANLVPYGQRVINLMLPKLTKAEILVTLMCAYGDRMVDCVVERVAPTVSDFLDNRLSTSVLQMMPNTYTSDLVETNGLLITQSMMYVDSHKLANMRLMKTGIKPQRKKMLSFKVSDRVVFITARFITSGASCNSWVSVMNALADGDFSVVISLAPKAQFGGPRDLVIQSLIVKILNGIAELCAFQMLRGLKEDLIAHPGRKSDIMKELRVVIEQSEDDVLRNKGEILRLHCSNSDESKWGPTHNTMSFLMVLLSLSELNRNASNLISIACVLNVKKKVLFDGDLVRTVINMFVKNGMAIQGRQGKYKIFKGGSEVDPETALSMIGHLNSAGIRSVVYNCLLTGKTYKEVYSHMGQGIFHKTSSLIAAIQCRANRWVFEHFQEFGSQLLPGFTIPLTVELKELRSSDDSITAMTYLCSNNDKAKVGMSLSLVYEYFVLMQGMLNIRKSAKHCSDANSSYCEVYSVFASVNMMIPKIKVQTAMITSLPGGTPFQTMLQLHNLAFDCLRDNGTLIDIAIPYSLAVFKNLFLSPPKSGVAALSPVMPSCYGGVMQVEMSTILAEAIEMDLERVAKHIEDTVTMCDVIESCSTSIDTRMMIHWDDSSSAGASSVESESNASEWLEIARATPVDKRTSEQCRAIRAIESWNLNGALSCGLCIGRGFDLDDLANSGEKVKSSSLYANPVRKPLSRKMISTFSDMRKSMEEEVKSSEPKLAEIAFEGRKAINEMTAKSKLAQSIRNQDPNTQAALNPQRALQNMRAGQLGHFVSVGEFVDAPTITMDTGHRLASFNSMSQWSPCDVSVPLRKVESLRKKAVFLRENIIQNSDLVLTMRELESTTVSVSPISTLDQSIVMRGVKKTASARAVGHDFIDTVLYYVDKELLAKANPRFRTEDSVRTLRQLHSSSPMHFALCVTLTQILKEKGSEEMTPTEVVEGFLSNIAIQEYGVLIEKKVLLDNITYLIGLGGGDIFSLEEQIIEREFALMGKEVLPMLSRDAMLELASVVSRVHQQKMKKGFGIAYNMPKLVNTMSLEVDLPKYNICKGLRVDYGDVSSNIQKSLSNKLQISLFHHKYNEVRALISLCSHLMPNVQNLALEYLIIPKLEECSIQKGVSDNPDFIRVCDILRSVPTVSVGFDFTTFSIDFERRMRQDGSQIYKCVDVSSGGSIVIWRESGRRLISSTAGSKTGELIEQMAENWKINIRKLFTGLPQARRVGGKWRKGEDQLFCTLRGTLQFHTESPNGEDVRLTYSPSPKASIRYNKDRDTITSFREMNLQKGKLVVKRTEPKFKRKQDVDGKTIGELIELGISDVTYKSQIEITIPGLTSIPLSRAIEIIEKVNELVTIKHKFSIHSALLETSDEVMTISEDASVEEIFDILSADRSDKRIEIQEEKLLVVRSMKSHQKQPLLQEVLHYLSHSRTSTVPYQLIPALIMSQMRGWKFAAGIVESVWGSLDAGAVVLSEISKDLRKRDRSLLSEETSSTWDVSASVEQDGRKARRVCTWSKFETLEGVIPNSSWKITLKRKSEGKQELRMNGRLGKCDSLAVALSSVTSGEVRTKGPSNGPSRNHFAIKIRKSVSASIEFIMVTAVVSILNGDIRVQEGVSEMMQIAGLKEISLEEPEEEDGMIALSDGETNSDDSVDSDSIVTIVEKEEVEHEWIAEDDFETDLD